MAAAILIDSSSFSCGISCILADMLRVIHLSYRNLLNKSFVFYSVLFRAAHLTHLVGAVHLPYLVRTWLPDTCNTYWLKLSTALFALWNLLWGSLLLPFFSFFTYNFSSSDIVFFKLMTTLVSLSHSCA